MNDPTTARRMTLADLGRTGGRGAIQLPIINGFNLGSQTLATTMTMARFHEISIVANEARLRNVADVDKNDVAQRDLNKEHAHSLANYILRGILMSVRNHWIAEGREVPHEMGEFLATLGAGTVQALQPFTANLADVDPSKIDVEVIGDVMHLHLHQTQRLRVIDGQHRRFGYELVSAWLHRVVTERFYPSARSGGLFVPDRADMKLTTNEFTIWSTAITEASSRLTVDCTVHLNLNLDQERQLFHDLNNLGKRPPKALSLAYDTSSPVTAFARDVLETEHLLGGLTIIDSGSKQSGTDQPENAIYRDDLIAICSLLFAGATNITKVMPSDVAPHHDYGRKFFETLTGQPHFAQPGWRSATLLSHPTMMKGLAELVHTFHGSREKDHNRRDLLLEALRDRQVDFSPSNPLWTIYFMTPEEREASFPGVTDYITPDNVRGAYAVRDGSGAILNFTSNTRDVSRYLGDLVRYQLREFGLPPRPALAAIPGKLAKATAKAKAKADKLTRAG